MSQSSLLEVRKEGLVGRIFSISVCRYEKQEPTRWYVCLCVCVCMFVCIHHTHTNTHISIHSRACAHDCTKHTQMHITHTLTRTLGRAGAHHSSAACTPPRPTQSATTHASTPKRRHETQNTPATVRQGHALRGPFGPTTRQRSTAKVQGTVLARSRRLCQGSRSASSSSSRSRRRLLLQAGMRATRTIGARPGSFPRCVYILFCCIYWREICILAGNSFVGGKFMDWRSDMPRGICCWPSDVWHRTCRCKHTHTHNHIYADIAILAVHRNGVAYACFCVDGHLRGLDREFGRSGLDSFGYHLHGRSAQDQEGRQNLADG